jgi:hypothetical protein
VQHAHALLLYIKRNIGRDIEWLAESEDWPLRHKVLQRQHATGVTGPQSSYAAASSPSVFPPHNTCGHAVSPPTPPRKWRPSPRPRPRLLSPRRRPTVTMYPRPAASLHRRPVTRLWCCPPHQPFPPSAPRPAPWNQSLGFVTTNLRFFWFRFDPRRPGRYQRLIHFCLTDLCCRFALGSRTSVPGRGGGAGADAGECSTQGDDLGSARVRQRDAMPHDRREGEMWNQLLFFLCGVLLSCPHFLQCQLLWMLILFLLGPIRPYLGEANSMSTC